MLTQSFLNEIDQDNLRNVDAVRQEIWIEAGDFQRLMDLRIQVTSPSNFQNFFMCIPGFILSNTEA